MRTHREGNSQVSRLQAVERIGICSRIRRMPKTRERQGKGGKQFLELRISTTTENNLQGFTALVNRSSVLRPILLNQAHEKARGSTIHSGFPCQRHPAFQPLPLKGMGEAPALWALRAASFMEVLPGQHPRLCLPVPRGATQNVLVETELRWDK